ncbi:MAG: hypothetical protein ACI92C_001974 [Neolewinella sp.]
MNERYPTGLMIHFGLLATRVPMRKLSAFDYTQDKDEVKNSHHHFSFSPADQVEIFQAETI